MKKHNEKTVEKFDQSTLEGFALSQARELLELVPGLDATTAGEVAWAAVVALNDAGKLNSNYADRPLWASVVAAQRIVRKRGLQQHSDILAGVYSRACADLTAAGASFDLLVSWHHKASE